MFATSPRARGRNPRASLIAALVAMPAIAIGQATPQAAPDPIAGTWSGRIGSGTSPNYAVTLALRLDSGLIRGSVSTIDGNGDIRSDSYDAATGALHLELARADERSPSLVFDGVAVLGMATGRVTRGNEVGTFMLTRAGSLPAVRDGDATSLPRSQLRAAFEELNGNIAKAAALVPADSFSWRPVSTVRTVGQLVGHVADAYVYYCGRAAGRRVQWSDAIAEGAMDRQRLIRTLNDAAAQCSAAYDAGNVGPLVVNFGHASLHYGNIVTYLRFLGLVPPTSG